MDTPMQDYSPAESRKRRAIDAEYEDDDIDERAHRSNDTATPTKRLRNRVGSAVPRHHNLSYSAHALLNHLAFTQLRVTTNFSNFNPSTSPVIICVIQGSARLYEPLCYMLPRLYSLAPSLQVLAIAESDEVDETYWDEHYILRDPELRRTLPVTESRVLDPDDLENFAGFVQSLPGDPIDVIVLIDATGRCVWHSNELDLGDDQGPALERELEDAKLKAEYATIVAERDSIRTAREQMGVERAAIAERHALRQAVEKASVGTVALVAERDAFCRENEQLRLGMAAAREKERSGLGSE